jgi:catechol 2,3-dioxygenase-like lactoylglutathione lyase family enzyme
MPKISLDHVHLFASNIEVTIKFFKKCFDAKVIWDEQAAGVRNVRIRIGQSFVHFYDQPPKGVRGGSIHHLGIETDDLDGLVAKMKSLGISFKNQISEEDKFKYVMVQGPDDLLIELFQCKEPERWAISRE